MFDKIAGCLFGMALGDALGRETEFMQVADIITKYPPNGFRELSDDPALVTDDTQMAIAVANALMQVPRPYQLETLEPILRDKFIDWYNDPKNNRSPGMTCLTSIENLMTGQEWKDATNISSKGCGANMRVQAVGLLPDEAETRAKLAQFQAALTHGHPTGLAAADLTAWVINDLLHGGDIDTLVERIFEYAKSQMRVYHQDWLDDLYKRGLMFPIGSDFIEYGWQQCLKRLNRLEIALEKKDYHTDPCILVGQGWIAEEAFSTALYCFLLYPNNPKAAMQRASVTSGDSDSIACITGAFAGVYNGLTSLPSDWVSRIEYHDELKNIATVISKMWKLQ